MVNFAFAQTSISISGNCTIEQQGHIIRIATAAGLEPTILKGPQSQCYTHFNPALCNLIKHGDVGFIAVTQQVQITSNCKPDQLSDDTTAKQIQNIVKFGGYSDIEVNGGITVFNLENDRTPNLQVPRTLGSAIIEGQLQPTPCNGNQVQ